MTDQDRQPASEDAELLSMAKELGLTTPSDSPKAKTQDESLREGESFLNSLKKEVKQMPGVQTAAQVGNVAKGLGKGAFKFAEDVGNTFIDAGNTIDDFLASKGFGQDDPDWERLNFAPKAGESFEEQAGFFIGRYLTPFGAAYKGVKALGMGAAATNTLAVTGSAAISAITVDPEDKNLAALVESFPELEGYVPDLLAVKDDDSVLVKRVKIGAEAALIDMLTLGTAKAFSKGIGIVKARKAFKKAQKVEEAVGSVPPPKDGEAPPPKDGDVPPKKEGQVPPKDVSS